MLDFSNLNEAQRKAVAWSGGPLLLLAGPGSGKTFTVTTRIRYLLEQGIPPDQILVITFTKDAAVEMQRRFRQMSGQSFPVQFGTFHSVFYHILLESNGFRPLNLLNDSRKKNIMLTILKRYQGSGELSEDAVRILSAISLYKNTADWERAAAAVPPEWRQHFEEIFASYSKTVREAGAVDFDDMLFECRRMLEEDLSARQCWQARFRHILIDEFQDCNPVQYAVIRLLSAEPYHIFAVGDDDQSIYGFRGAEPDILRQFTEDYQAERLLLDVNYRSTEEIVRASLAVIEENANRFPKALRAAALTGEAKPETERKAGKKAKPETEGRAGKKGKAEAEGKAGKEAKPETKRKAGKEGKAEAERKAGKEGKAEAEAKTEKKVGVEPEREAPEEKAALTGESTGVQIRAFRDRAAQEGWLLQQAGSWRERHGEDGARCAVLFRTNSQMQKAAAALHGAGISFYKREAVKNVYEHFIAKDMMAYLLLASGEWRREYLLRIVNRPVRYISREAVGEGRSIPEMQEYYRRQLKGQMGDYRWEVLERLSCLRRQLDSLSCMPPALGIRYILKAVDYDSYLREAAKGSPEKLAEWRELGEWLKEDAARYQTVRAWAEAQEDYGEGLERGPAPGVNAEEAEPLWLMTAHGAKGLEFDRVIIPDCNERTFPYGELLGQESIEEERRIFYVAMTRAKKSLELLYLTGDRARPRLPSRFLNPLLNLKYPLSTY